ncbi:MAG: ABC transporter ATP-binding protein [Actinomycetaceae bacterium]|nr:ABC transporter ATP-binding protein [Arcanobacterium sp.]MDD7504377.1 ABC transporter ATP-binding protein [Actinomycetaceae bacterium]MDY6143041.1 ABC transporter ATP-binding protein [Arcanobacterium sp.]
MTNDIQISGLTKEYGKPGSPKYVRALDSVELHIPSGQIVGLMGENGSGKTTLLKILAGALANYAGSIRLGGTAVGVETKAYTSYLPDTSALPPNLTGLQVAHMYGEFFDDFDYDLALEKMKRFAVPSDRAGTTLSKGQREKMHIAMAMARRARFYLLDEPLSGVDPAARDQILGGILADLPEDSTMIISTHLIHDVEPIISHALFMHEGKVILSGDADALRAEHGQSLDAMFRTMYR